MAVTIKWMVLMMALLIFSVPLSPVNSAKAKIDSIDFELDPDEIAITFLNVPEGEAALVQSPTDAVLIDTGGPHSFDALLEQLKLYRVAHIHTLILTNHQKAFRSHVLALTRHFKVSSVMTSGLIKKDILIPDLPLSIYDVWTGTKEHEILPNVYIQKQSESPEGDLNFYIRYGQNRLLYLSNQEAFEKSLSKKHSAVSARIVKLSNFGQRAFKSPLTLQKMDPEVAVLYKGKNKTLNEELVEELSNAMIETFNIAQVGNVTFKMSREHYEMMTMTEAEENE
ncbi:hypothetical protein PU629_14315 [Pullulanibacillus sp. KACC 23026]|uniref:hypothetical protein n=1 Tax=Pullulanibacillus sp. KACC 23026 TaxID=3028315 RepID=UPI0023AEE96D|nr:hypothetical protein [Pullulanibacillus sp. KACC 23026]WEG11334.1 hypothetical protein PU629_14315 [Pullulanibacillus sp. KACC 23026]